MESLHDHVAHRAHALKSLELAWDINKGHRYKLRHEPNLRCHFLPLHITIVTMPSPGPSSSLPRSSSPTSDPLVDLQQEKEARLKRRIAELEAQVASKNNTSKPSAASVSLPLHPPPSLTYSRKSYVTMGRVLRKVVSLFEPIEALVSEYDRRQELAETREEEGDDTPIVHTLEYMFFIHRCDITNLGYRHQRATPSPWLSGAPEIHPGRQASSYHHATR